MPTYEYACSSCGNTWEEIQKITEPALEDCPACKKRTAQRQISGGNFILKGGGWYADLYSKPKAGNDSKPSSTATDTKAESKTEKTETKTDTKKDSGSGGSSGPAAPSGGSGSSGGGSSSTSSAAAE